MLYVVRARISTRRPCRAIVSLTGSGTRPISLTGRRRKHGSDGHGVAGDLSAAAGAGAAGGPGRTSGGCCYRQMLDAVFCVLDNGIKWRPMPVGFPAWDRVYAFFDNGARPD
jgi:hypothetical protein